MAHRYLESELIITPQGTVYHLNVHPEQLAPHIILVGDPERVPLVSKYLDHIEHQVHQREFVCHTGYLGAKRVSIIATGIGTDNIDIVLNEIDFLLNVDLENRVRKPEFTQATILRLGTSGALAENIPLDSFVFSRYAIGMDNLMHFYPKNVENPIQDWFKSRFPEVGFCPYFAYADEELCSGIQQWAKFQQISCYEGITLTNPGFYAPQNRIFTEDHYPLQDFFTYIKDFNYKNVPVTNLEMETSGILGLAHFLGHKAASLSVILAHRGKHTFSSNPAKAVEQLITFGLSYVETL